MYNCALRGHEHQIGSCDVGILSQPSEVLKEISHKIRVYVHASNSKQHYQSSLLIKISKACHTGRLELSFPF